MSTSIQCSVDSCQHAPGAFARKPEVGESGLNRPAEEKRELAQKRGRTLPKSLNFQQRRPRVFPASPGGPRLAAVAAEIVRTMRGISPSVWQAARTAMGETAAAITIAAILERAEAIRSPGGYLRAPDPQGGTGTVLRPADAEGAPVVMWAAAIRAGDRRRPLL